MDEPFIQKYLAMQRELRPDPPPPGYTYNGLHGQNYPIAADQTSPGPFMVEPKQCFDNAYRLARRWPKRYRYVEGIACGIIPMHHAWVLNAAGEVVDPTWSLYSRLGTEYFGVIIPLDIAKQVRNRKCLSIIDNWSSRWPLFREPWPVILERKTILDTKL